VTGWNLRSKEAGSAEMLAPFHGSYLPFARTKAEREATGDPRPSVAERYPTREAYVTRVRQAAAELQQDRFLLESDAKQIIDAAAKRELP